MERVTGRRLELRQCLNLGTVFWHWSGEIEETQEARTARPKFEFRTSRLQRM